MRCPICRQELVEGEMRSYETLMDHVSDPNGQSPLRKTYVCSQPSEACPVDDVYKTLFWDDMGDVYIMDNGAMKAFHIEELAEGGMLEPLGSFARRSACEENYRYMKPAFSIVWFSMKWDLIRDFKCNEEGEVLKKKYHIQASKKVKGEQYYARYDGFWSMLIFSIRHFNTNLKEYRRSGYDFQIKRAFNPLFEWQKEDNYRKVFKWYINTFYSKVKKELK